MERSPTSNIESMEGCDTKHVVVLKQKLLESKVNRNIDYLSAFIFIYYQVLYL